MFIPFRGIYTHISRKIQLSKTISILSAFPRSRLGSHKTFMEFLLRHRRRNRHQSLHGPCAPNKRIPVRICMMFVFVFVFVFVYENVALRGTHICVSRSRNANATIIPLMLFWCGCSHIHDHEHDIHQNNRRKLFAVLGFVFLFVHNYVNAPRIFSITRHPSLQETLNRYWFNPFKPEFTIVIFIHYKPQIAVAILDL